MINKTLNENSANRVEKIILSKNDRNAHLFAASTKLMEASVELLPVSTEMSAILADMGNKMLEEIKLEADKMEEAELQTIIDDILSMKGKM